MNDVTTYTIDKIYEYSSGPKHKHSDRVNFRCPYCGDSKTDKLKTRGWFYFKTDSFNCFNCGKSASAFGLVSQLSNKSYKEVRVEYFKSSNQSIQSILTLPKPSIEIVKKKTVCELPEDCVAYTSNRLCKDIVDNRKIFSAPFIPSKFSLYFSPSKMRMVIPWLENGDVTYWQARSLISGHNPKYLFPPNTTRPVFPLTIDKSFPYLFLHEGVFNAIWCMNSIVTGSVLLSSTQKETLHNYQDIGFKLVYVFDNWNVDTASKENMLKIASKDRQALFFNWDKKIRQKDLNDVALQSDMINNFRDKDYLSSRVISSSKLIVTLG